MMAENETGNLDLTDAAKASVLNSGVASQFKHAVHGHDNSDSKVLDALKQDAQAMADVLQQLLNGGGLNDTAALKTSAALLKLQGVLSSNHVSREALATVLSEAATAISAAEGNSKAANAVTLENTWQKIETYNKEIDDDFEKMRKAGVLFNENSWNKHRQLSDYLKEHPCDISKQKELDVVDDALLLQAEPQLGKYPDAKPDFDDAKKKSEDRHKDVVEAINLSNAKNQNVIELTNSDWGSVQGENVTINDVASPAVVKQKGKQDRSAAPIL